jgi:cytosine/creatinine deaminase
VDEFMQAAIEEAKTGESEGGQAFGSVLVRGGQIIGRGHNRIFQRQDPTRHAEIEALGDAGVLESYADTVIYATALPCPMCAGAIIHLGVPKVVIGFSGLKGDTLQRLRSFGIDVVELHLDACRQLLLESWAKYPERYPPSARAAQD